ncbi:MAG: glycosyltransferase family 4 protein [Bdellovibrionales bacterium]|jgi:glycosyltransferase involved in cell wall biosynthesis
MKKTILYIVNVDWFFLSHRLPIALEAQRQGYGVHVACGMSDKKEVLESHGIIVHPLALERGKASLASYFASFFEIVFLLLKLRPDILHLVTIKPVIFGGIAARLTRIPACVAAVSGLGFVFLDQGIRARLRRSIVLDLYRFALGSARTKVIFQNVDDRHALMQGAGIKETQTVLIRGSGVSLSAYDVKPEPEGTPVVMLVARLLVDKGVREFAEASRLLKNKGIEARFCLVGSTDPANPASLTEDEIQGWVREGIVESWGHHADMPAILPQSNIVALPSYREGMPKALLEAAACGRAVVTTDVAGCRDAITPDVTGLLVTVRNAASLANGLEKLILDPQRRQAMGLAGRKLAEEAFDIREVVKKHLEIYNSFSKARS